MDLTLSWTGTFFLLIAFLLNILPFTRTRNPNAMQTASFEWTDLLEPTKMLCKVDNYMSAVNGHIDVTTDPDSYVSFRTRCKL